MNRKATNNEQGYVALVSVILISATLLILTVVLGWAALYARSNVLDYENKKVSVALAEACIETALVQLAKDPYNYPGTIQPTGTHLTIDAGKTCSICGISGSGPYTIITRAVYQKAFTNISVVGTLGPSNFIVTAWNEQANYNGNCAVP